jgi:HPt (histidine-containing phosphotransfer) domain-containing protein
MSNDFHMINLDYLNEISEGNTDLIHDLVEMFIDQVPDYQKSMNTLHAKKDWRNLGRIAHKAKSAILMVGMNELAQELKKLEENAKEGKNINEYQEIIAKFVRESDIALQELLSLKKTE